MTLWLEIKLGCGDSYEYFSSFKIFSSRCGLLISAEMILYLVHELKMLDMLPRLVMKGRIRSYCH